MLLQKIGENDKELLDQQKMIISGLIVMFLFIWMIGPIRYVEILKLYYEIFGAGYRRWGVKFPIISRIVQQAMNV